MLPTNGTLTFPDGVTVASFTVPIIDNTVVQNPRSFNVTLSSATGGASIGPVATSPLRFWITTSASACRLPRSRSTKAMAPRLFLSSASMAATASSQVNYSTTNSLATNGIATAGIDYLPTSGVLTFNNGETFKTFTVPILDNSIVDGDRTFGITISNVQPSSAAQLLDEVCDCDYTGQRCRLFLHQLGSFNS